MQTSDTHLISEHTAIDAFSKTLLEIYRLAREEPLERFLETMLECIQSIIPFKSAWWGRGSEATYTPSAMHSCYFYNLPDNYFDAWHNMRFFDNTLELIKKNSTNAIRIDFQKDTISEQLMKLGREFHFNKIMCVQNDDTISGLGNHLSLYRDKSAPAFSTLELQLFQSLMPHLLVATSINHIRNCHELFGSPNGTEVVLATCDINGILRSCEPAFAELIQTEYPDWHGPQLPFAPTKKCIHGQHLIIDVQTKEDVFLLLAHPISAIDQLSTREKEVAISFGQGLTYKEIAQEIGISPNTVRYYLRSVYTKLEVHNKADISRLLAELTTTNSS
ncbi:helix-turn-helix transcriptional regulator [Marinomonas sp. CT5]|uniref:helix-turn-helix transcriptional regulator n=1 Tax=Marinomonas sp. CT5 TaxID=2066133 RepID=UPI0017CC3B66|nr:helix-turn-helix transcriptional regulator [Marinomonas sp. CT5]NVK72958.1 helix-turn-helix transcriptional regulator [Oceanospirillaceae bacterium]QUX97237.1 helix-turn-helix transcriptional regulator [Marinomonas sp. CT5]